MTASGFSSLDAEAATGDLLALRDRALMAVMLYGLVRVGGAVGMRVQDFEDAGEHASLLLREKGGKERRIACPHNAREYLRAYIAAAGFEPLAKEPLFQTAPGRRLALTGEAISTFDALRAVRRRCKTAALPSSICNHSSEPRASPSTRRTAAGSRMPRSWPATPTRARRGFTSASRDGSRRPR